ncbi:MAG: GNAT family N-acetyltransferase [Asgard group archaeon]|nr:GNAT family N-acetyltransferase [Asgard group archaeon]
MKVSYMDKQFRKFQQKDIEQLKEICDNCFPNKDVFLIVESFFDTEHFYIVENQDELLGFIIFAVNSKNIIHIMILAVKSIYQRKGIGSYLLDKIEPIIQKTNTRKIRLEVQTDNEVAIDFYKKHGYIIATTIDHYYEDGSDAFLMIKEIES